jgi:hypothetical protein
MARRHEPAFGMAGAGGKPREHRIGGELVQPSVPAVTARGLARGAARREEERSAGERASCPRMPGSGAAPHVRPL